MKQQVGAVSPDQARADAIYEALKAHGPEVVEAMPAKFRRTAWRLAVHPELRHLARVARSEAV